MTEPPRVVLAADVLVDATATASATWQTWPRVPPGSANAAADCLGIVAEPREWALWLSGDLLELVARILLDADHGLGWRNDHVGRYLEVLHDVAWTSGGGVVTLVPAVIGRGADAVQRTALAAAAAAVGAAVVVTADKGLLHLHPWSPPGGDQHAVLHPTQFRARVDAARRGRPT